MTNHLLMSAAGMVKARVPSASAEAATSAERRPANVSSGSIGAGRSRGGKRARTTAASKAASDHLALSYFHSYGMPVIVTNCSNNFGPNQHEEKLIPATIMRILKHEPARVYGSGLHVRDWLSVHDHCEALILLAHAGSPGERYCIGGENEKTNLQIINAVHAAVIQATGEMHDLTLEFTNDRPTDDKRYSINCEKLKALGWKPTADFWNPLVETVRFYLRESLRGGTERAQGKGGTDA